MSIEKKTVGTNSSTGNAGQFNEGALTKLIKEISFTTSRSGGKGGQNVNKVETKVELSFDVLNSMFLTDDEKQLILEKHKNKINDDGILKLTTHTERTQLGNKKKVIEKFETLIVKALTPVKKRKPTKISDEERERRLAEKKFQSEKKERRNKSLW